ncbi:MAG: alpha/beta hydrolase [Burkholderiaceae bacterium]|nr:alpha/beta hydrolase [Burkholderiaceae bacterium]
MTKPILHFAHANSYPAGTYRVFFDALNHHYEVRSLPMHAHNPRYPITDGWRELAAELVDELAARSGPVILVGHSMGGMLSLMAAKARPDLVRGVVLLDAPVVAGWRAFFLRVARHSALAERASPARFSVRRRNVWPDAEAAYQHFAAKEIFALWGPGVLRDYMQHGLAPHPDGVTLRFTREAETAVYRGLPDHIGKMVQSGFPVPVGFIGGINSEECRRAGMAATRRLVGAHYMQIAGGHLFPMESPGIAAAAVHELIQGMFSN